MITDLVPTQSAVPLASGINWEFVILLTFAAIVAIAVAWLFSSGGGGSSD